MGRSPEEIFLYAVMSACSEMGSQLKLQAVSPNRERSCSSVFRGDESPRACAGGGFLHITAFFFSVPLTRGLAPAAWERIVTGGGKSREL